MVVVGSVVVVDVGSSVVVVVGALVVVVVVVVLVVGFTNCGGPPSAGYWIGNPGIIGGPEL